MHERVAFVSLSPRKSAFAKQWQKVYGLDDYDEDDVGDLVDETEMIELRITIPPNVKPGAMVATQTEYGIIHVPVPEGSEPGEEIQFKIKKPAPQEQPQAGNVNNPADWTAVIDASVKALLPEPENARVLHIVTEKVRLCITLRAVSVPAVISACACCAEHWFAEYPDISGRENWHRRCFGEHVLLFAGVDGISSIWKTYSNVRARRRSRLGP